MLKNVSNGGIWIDVYRLGEAPMIVCCEWTVGSRGILSVILDGKDWALPVGFAVRCLAAVGLGRCTSPGRQLGIRCSTGRWRY